MSLPSRAMLLAQDIPCVRPEVMGLTCAQQRGEEPIPPSAPAAYEALLPVLGALKWLALILGVIGLLIIAGKIVSAAMRGHAGQAAQSVGEIPWVLLSVCLTLVALPLVSQILPGSMLSGSVQADASVAGENREAFDSALSTIISWGKGVVAVLGVLGLLFAAGRMALGRIGRSDLVVEGVGTVTWVIFGISLMLLSSVIITGVAGL
ncbi:hypothetical protein ACQEU5_05325 [Marinactinospora thermotolerans]|uniref:Uncharacterized protein n=1 Tax=Marinactinospora thermotolerans DSM 45154 TaxID=1122192 RepID=A0A1T4QQ19_9ACTN|nr:hypothetical protein [Marinactinospora thermotolerans]SKA05859.1 hypothetical protein SAMN02745673_02359 [Marinactinospora thermotolerans DSM 45154]